jgi:hypothetical protein
MPFNNAINTDASYGVFTEFSIQVQQPVQQNFTTVNNVNHPGMY